MSSPTKLSIVVAGGGIAGLCFAIEASLNGQKVRLFERRPDFSTYGDIIVLQSSAMHSPRKWPGFYEKAQLMAYDPVMLVKRSDGETIVSVPIGLPNDDGMPINRSDLHGLLHEYALQVGVSIEFNATIVDYHETKDVGSITLADGRIICAEVIVAADGVGSEASLLISGKKEEPKSSGFSIYRSTFPIAPVLENPIIQEAYSGKRSQVTMFLGKNTHIVVGKTANTICWAQTHVDNHNASEDWHKTSSIDDALTYVDGWHPFLKELIKSTPDGVCTDWKVMWRNPRPNSVSPEARIIQIGDAAHAFLPTSGSGGTMAMEDAFSLAACLDIACRQPGAPGNAPLALRIHNLLRWERVTCAQKLGFKNREIFHSADWDSFKKDPAQVANITQRWLMNHNPTKYAHEMYEAAASHLQHGTSFTNTNGPLGYTYKPWTIEELLEGSSSNLEKDEGDWS